MSLKKTAMTSRIHSEVIAVVLYNVLKLVQMRYCV